MFTPITQRSLRVRLLYITLYGFLLLGAITMIVPFVITISGSIEPSSDSRNGFLSTYLFDRHQMWNRYLGAKYQGTADLLRMAWNDPDVNFHTAEMSDGGAGSLPLWDEFIAETKPDARYYMLGFLRPNLRMPSYASRQFRIWLLDQYGNDLGRLNEDLGTQFTTPMMVVPPSINMIGPASPRSKLMSQFEKFCAMQPQERLVAWDVGGYYRSVFLPNTFGDDVAAFNEKYGTTFRSYEEIPFSATVPEVGTSEWMLFVSRVLRPNFVELTPGGVAAQTAAGLNKEEFIRARAAADQLRVVSMDTLFAEWALAKKGTVDARIPQQALDHRAFVKEEGFWKGQFLVLNYQRVTDEILLHGRAILNTLILVILSVGGALVVNPLAAYALSRYKLRKTYHILLFCLATIAFPAEVTMIPVFLQLKELSLLNTFGALVLPGLAHGFSIFLLKGFFDSLPKELYEAAELDGASEWTMFWQISMYLSKPILAVIALGAFTAAYGTFFYALILAPDPKMWTIMVYVYQLRSAVDPPVVYASLILTAIPTLLVFIFCQNLILRGIVVPSDK